MNHKTPLIFTLMFTLLLTSVSCTSDVGNDVAPQVQERGKTEVDIRPKHVAVPAAVHYKQASLGMGLTGIADWSEQYPFIDFMKQSREWKDWKNKVEGFHVDENDWIIKLKPNQVAGTVFHTVTQGSPLIYDRAIVFYEGEGDIVYSGGARKIDAESKSGRHVISLKTGSHLLEIFKTNPDNYIRNIRIIPEALIADFEHGEMFNPDWTKLVSDFYAVRFMDWMQTNGSKQSDWANRPQRNHRSYMTQGVPLEVMIQLANKFNAVPWFNIPHLADENYMLNFAKIIKAQLNPHLLVYIEHSNEVWNWQFGQAHYARDTGKERWGKDKGDAHLQWHGMRTATVCDVFKKQVFKEDHGRVKCVLALQTGWHGSEYAALDCPLWVAEGNKPCVEHGMDYIGITTYFSGGLNGPVRGGDRNHKNIIRHWADSGKKGLDSAFEQLEDGELLKKMEWMDKFKGAVPDLKRHLSYWKNVADKRGLGIVAYEGGQHITSNAHELQDDGRVVAFHTEINRDPRLANLYRELKEVWRTHGGELEVYFDDVRSPSKWGSWGALEHLQDTAAPKYQVLIELNKQHTCWWDGCAIIGTSEK